MPSGRPRIAPEDSRSESSSAVTHLKERASIGGVLSKSKKTVPSTLSESISSSKLAALNNAMEVMTATLHGTAQASLGAIQQQTDWNSLPPYTLHSYRAAYKIPTPSSYSHPHADLLYNASEVAQRAPSQVLARRTLQDLKAHRRKIAQVNGNTNGVHKSATSRFKQKEKDRDETSSQTSQNARKKQKNANGISRHDLSIAQSIEPPSPTIVSQSADSTSDQASSTLLNASDPESTIIGRQSPTALATTVRKHFNAQQLNEADTIARFTYVARQQGYGSGTLAKSNGGLAPSSMGGGSGAHPNSPRSNAPIRVEGSAGDGNGWIMGSMGRQVRMSDTSSGGTFRLRFRP